MVGVGKKVIEIWAILCGRLTKVVHTNELFTSQSSVFLSSDTICLGPFWLCHQVPAYSMRPYLDNFVTKCYTFSPYSGDSDPN